jgi:hypothetical protein
MKISQREAVFQAVRNAFAEAGIEFTEGMNCDEVMTDAMHKSVSAELTEGFIQGITYLDDTPSNRNKLANPAEMSKYVSGLKSNWLRKDIRLNGGVEYAPKNPGSRAGSSDPQLKALKQLAVKFKGTEKAAEIAKHIATRTATIAEEKAKKVTVDISVLSPELRKSLGLE